MTHAGPTEFEVTWPYPTWDILFLTQFWGSQIQVVNLRMDIQEEPKPSNIRNLTFAC